MAARDNRGPAQRQKAMEGLKELAGMIASAYRRRLPDSGETNTAFAPPNNGHGVPSSEITTVPADVQQLGEYSESIKIENFLRRKASKAKSSGSHKVDKVSE